MGFLGFRVEGLPWNSPRATVSCDKAVSSASYHSDGDELSELVCGRLFLLSLPPHAVKGGQITQTCSFYVYFKPFVELLLDSKPEMHKPLITKNKQFAAFILYY